MSLGIAFKGPEGIVLAADSRVTLMTQLAGQNILLPATYDNATKMLSVSVKEQTHVGAVTYGVGALGGAEPRTAHSFMPEFEEQLRRENVGRLSVEAFAKRLSDFFAAQWKALPPITPPGAQQPDMAFLVGGYDENQPYGRIFEFFVPNNPIPRETLPGGQFGLTWGGQREYVDRLLRGFDDGLPMAVQQFLKLPDAQRDTLRQQLTTALSSPIPYQFLPLQDCVDLSIFLIRTTIKLQTWLVGVRGVGGAIDVATITRIEGFRAIQRKRIVGEA